MQYFLTLPRLTYFVQLRQSTQVVDPKFAGLQNPLFPEYLLLCPQTHVFHEPVLEKKKPTDAEIQEDSIKC